MDELSEEDRFSNYCVDVVTLQRFEPGLIHLFRQQAGEWASVVELYQRAGAPNAAVPPKLKVTWLPSPSGQSDYAVILFCDEELQWSSTAYYNTERLLGEANAHLAATK